MNRCGNRLGRAMVLAAGLGTRARPLTEELAKPLQTLAGHTLLDHMLDRLALAGVGEVVINTHFQAASLAAHVASRGEAPPRITLRREPELLDTGGAVAAALAEGLLGPEPFLILNSDNFWLDGPSSMLERLAAQLAPGVDAVLLLHRAFQVPAEIGYGDFMLDPWGIPRRRTEREIAPYVFAGIQLATPALFAGSGTGAFPMAAVWDRALAEGRLRAVVHDGLWFHLSNPGDLGEAEAALLNRATGETR